MGFNSVYRCLQELFPQVDARLLRAVAIEHPKDADLAAGIVLSEVIPLMSQRFTPPATPPQNERPGASTNIEVESEEQGYALKHDQLCEETDLGSSSAPQSVPVENFKIAESEEQGNALQHHQLVEETHLEPSLSPQPVPVNNGNIANCFSGPHQNATLGFTLSATCHSNNDADKFLESNESKELNIFSVAEENFDGEIADKIVHDTSNGLSEGASDNFDHVPVCVYVENGFSGMCHEMGPEQTLPNRVTASSTSNGTATANYLDEELKDYNNPVDDIFYDNSYDNYRLEKWESTLIGMGSSVAEAVCHGGGHAPIAKECSLQSEFDSGPSIAVNGNVESGCSFSKQDCSVSESDDFKDEIGENNVVSQSNQVFRIGLLDEIITEAKTNKKTLFSSMESLINLMREVELVEKASEQAKMDAAQGGSDIMVRVEELKKMLVHAKEANDMHAGEVYGEKAILATELRELQSRLLSLSDERDTSLAILEEIRQTLEARLAAAEELRKAAGQEKHEKEEFAQKALAEQEAIMEKVVQESIKLQQEAEENSKLQEFLMDRGRVVDMLQGEISVICQDIRLLKEKFDANLPLSKSFTSSQTSCILASSGSSHKSMTSDVGSEHGDLSEMLKASPATSIDGLSSKSGHEEEKASADHKALLDDGWDIFEKDEELNF